MFASKLRWWCIKMIQLSKKWARMSRFMGWDYITSLIYGETPNPISHYYTLQTTKIPPSSRLFQETKLGRRSRHISVKMGHTTVQWCDNQQCRSPWYFLFYSEQCCQANTGFLLGRMSNIYIPPSPCTSTWLQFRWVYFRLPRLCVKQWKDQSCMDGRGESCLAMIGTYMHDSTWIHGPYKSCMHA